MMRKLTALALVMVLMVSVAVAIPLLQEQRVKLNSPPMMDTFEDTIYYDDNTTAWWYGGFNNFSEATRFTPLADFELQAAGLAFNSTGTVDLYVCDDAAGLPGTVLWSGTAVIPSASTWIPTIIDTVTGAYTFTAGTDFWIKFTSVGPPYETFDYAPVIPQRSYFQTGTTWSSSPGDNFIRAVGEYLSAIVDVSVDSVWHGENYFVTNGSSFSVSAQVGNNSATPSSFDVGCHIYTEIDDVTYTFFDSLALQSVMLAPGATTNITFPAYTWNTDDRYRIDVVAYFPGDVNPDNNAMSTETQVYTTPPPNVELRYDDTVIDGHAYTSTIGDGWGMRFDPQQSGAYDLASVSIEVSFSTGDLAARVKVMDDTGDAPGAVLFETVQVMADGWNDFDVNASVTGAFYVFYIFENGPSTSALGTDGYPSSAQAWDCSLTGGYNADPGANDWGIRATLGEGAAYPDFDITLTYVSGSPVPAGGGNLNFDVYMANVSGSAQDIDVWLESAFEGGTPTTLVMRHFDNYQSGWAINRPGMYYPVPGSWAAGNYTFGCKVGVNPGIAWEEDSFPFVKSGSDYVEGFVPFPVAGAPNPFDEVITGGMDLPSEYALLGSYPNPFNPTANISYALPAAGKVMLSVYDVNGRLVNTLVDGSREAGVHEVIFDASNLASGVYIYRLSAGDFSATGKMVLMK